MDHLFLHHPSNKEIYCSYVLRRYGQGVATTHRSMRRHVRRATPLSPLTRQYIHLHFLTSGPLLTVHVIHSILVPSTAQNLPSDIIEATCRPHFTFSGDGSISGIHPLRWPIMSPGLIMSRLPRSPLCGLCQSGILIDRQRGEVATPECFDSSAICHQTRRWEVDGFGF